MWMLLYYRVMLCLLLAILKMLNRITQLSSQSCSCARR